MVTSGQKQRAWGARVPKGGLSPGPEDTSLGARESRFQGATLWGSAGAQQERPVRKAPRPRATHGAELPRGPGGHPPAGSRGPRRPPLPLAFSPAKGSGHVGLLAKAPGAQVLGQFCSRNLVGFPQIGRGPLHRLFGASLFHQVSSELEVHGPGGPRAELLCASLLVRQQRVAGKTASLWKSGGRLRSLLPQAGGHMAPPTPATTEGQLSELAHREERSGLP